MKVGPLIAVISILSSLLLIVFFPFFRKRNKEKKFWVIFFYLIASLVSDIALIILRPQDVYKIPRYYTYSAFTVIEYTCISSFFYLTFTAKSFRSFILACYPLFYGIAFYTFLIPPPNYTFDSLAAPTEGILVIIFTILFFYEQLNNPDVTFIYSNKEFWIIIAFFIYLSATLFLFNMAADLTKDQRNAYWIINNFANIIKNILFAVAFSISPSKPTSATQRKPQLSK